MGSQHIFKFAVFSNLSKDSSVFLLLIRLIFGGHSAADLIVFLLADFMKGNRP